MVEKQETVDQNAIRQLRGLKLAYLREKLLKVSARKLCEDQRWIREVGAMHLSNISHFEKFTRKVPDEYLAGIAKFAVIPPEWMFDETIFEIFKREVDQVIKKRRVKAPDSKTFIGSPSEIAKELKKEICIKVGLTNDGLKPSMPKHYIDLARAFYFLGEFDTAINFCNIAIRKWPKDLRSYYIRGDIFRKTKNYDSALVDCNKAIELDKECSLAYFTRARIYIESAWKEKGDLAIYDLTKAIELDGSNAGPYFVRACINRLKGNPEEALKDLDISIKIDPLDYEIYRQRAYAYKDLGDTGNRLKEYEKLRELNLYEGITLNEEAWILATCKDAKFRNGKLAVEIASKAVKINPCSSYYDTMAAAYAEVGDFSKAIAIEEIALLELRNEKAGKFDCFLPRYVKRLEGYREGIPCRG